MKDLKALNRKWARIFLAMILGFFGIVFLANFFFVKWALETNPGLETRSAYERGVNYNSELAEARAEDAMGWDLGITSKAVGEGDTKLTLTLKDADGGVIEGAELTARMVRLVKEGFDFSLEFTEIGEGVYESTFTLPMSGQWELRLLAKSGDLQSRFEKRLRL